MDDVLCPVVIGRSAELVELSAALDAAASGSGRSIFLTGDEGVGKSRLAREVCSLAAARDFMILSGRCTQSAVPVPYRPIAEALMSAARTGLVPDMPAISNYRKVLGALVPEWSRPGDGKAHVEPVIVGEAVLRLLTQSGAKGGLLLIEDLRRADPETVAILEYLADNIQDANVLCLVTLRNSVPSPATDLLHSATARRVATEIEIPRLTPDEVSQMGARCLGVEQLPADVGKLLADCDGLPFAIEEILAAAVSSGELAKDETGWHVDGEVSTGVPDAIADSVASRLASLGLEASNVVVSAAVLGRQFDWALLPAVAGADEAAVLDALHRASDVQLIEPSPDDGTTVQFRHSMTREAILSAMLAPELASRAAAATAAIVREHPGLPGTWCELVAELHVLADQPVDAVRLLVTSGRRALLQGAISSALATLGNARQLLRQPGLDEPTLAMEVDEVVLEAYALAGDHKRLAPLADDLLTRLAAAGASQRRQALVRLKAASTRPEDDPAAAAAHLAAAAAIAAELHDAELSGRIDSVAARNALAASKLDEAEQLARQALETAEGDGLVGWAAEVALQALEVIGRRERSRSLPAARHAFERALEIADRQEMGIWRIRFRHELSTLDMLADGSADHLDSVRELTREAGSLCVGTVINLQLANIASLGPDLDGALALAVNCQRSAAQITAPRIEAMAICLQASVAAVQTDRERAEHAAQCAEDLLPGDTEILSITRGQTRVLTSLFRDEVIRALREDHAAWRYVSSSLAAAPAGGGFYSALQSPLLAPQRPVALHALLQALGGSALAARDGGQAAQPNACEALRLARATGADTSWNAGCLAYGEAVLAGRAGDRKRADRLAHEGRGHFAQFAPWWNHLMWRLVVPDALADGWGDPVSWMREAVEGFDASGHEQLASACRGVLKEAGESIPRSGRGRATVPAQLRTLGVTSREMDVFLLVAGGRSNADIAEKLYISPKTVDTHVASLIAKTGQRSRRELVAHAARFRES